MTRNTVLVIDDDPEYRELVSLILTAHGLAVLEAEDCRAGVALLQLERARLRLVLVDYFMPGMEPALCLGALRRVAGDEVRLVLVTAADHPSARAASLGLSEWLAKPFALRDLERLVLGA